MTRTRLPVTVARRGGVDGHRGPDGRSLAAGSPGGDVADDLVSEHHRLPDGEVADPAVARFSRRRAWQSRTGDSAQGNAGGWWLAAGFSTV
ncbi:hypothetical protein [Streptomyces sp. NPDC058252]|uniref:hypothetical protein n=1 Tax=Streptomyces sp. NPDC058252 TaxID=3346405 RepID=UPI0036E5A63E